MSSLTYSKREMLIPFYEVSESRYLTHTSRNGWYNLCYDILQVIPRQLCDNAGFDATDVLNKLRQKHALPSG